MGCGDPMGCGGATGCRGLVGCGELMGCGDPSCCGGPSGCGDATGCGGGLERSCASRRLPRRTNRSKRRRRCVQSLAGARRQAGSDDGTADSRRRAQQRSQSLWPTRCSRHPRHVPLKRQEGHREQEDRMLQDSWVVSAIAPNKKVDYVCRCVARARMRAALSGRSTMQDRVSAGR